ncbi:hypothetical protein H310_13676 [Aphanomyces invadans]|uniref:RRM domain-containing protein n=1 Tax=Aphanomyces invadans TaxID=157072 RepID=A0A024TE46_9STRA|nr:hypothetical protein H310_13676 [Aphanomyces invadans]ETV91856.1 hypothetical protein H310_13676 [Aphanomyces invadans]|eukprot:XP_008879493.1 hypothetical protein H310_13676 [Aphanomyces invadans]
MSDNQKIKNMLLRLVDSDSDSDRCTTKPPASGSEKNSPKKSVIPLRRQAVLAAAKRKAAVGSDDSDDDSRDRRGKRAGDGDSDEDYKTMKSKKRSRSSSSRTKSTSHANGLATDSATPPAALTKKEREAARRERDNKQKRDKRAAAKAANEKRPDDRTVKPHAKSSKAASTLVEKSAQKNAMATAMLMARSKPETSKDLARSIRTKDKRARLVDRQDGAAVRKKKRPRADSDGHGTTDKASEEASAEEERPRTYPDITKEAIHLRPVHSKPDKDDASVERRLSEDQADSTKTTRQGHEEVPVPQQDVAAVDTSLCTAQARGECPSTLSESTDALPVEASSSAMPNKNDAAIAAVTANHTVSTADDSVDSATAVPETAAPQGALPDLIESVEEQLERPPEENPPPGDTDPTAAGLPESTPRDDRVDSVAATSPAEEGEVAASDGAVKPTSPFPAIESTEPLRSSATLSSGEPASVLSIPSMSPRPTTSEPATAVAAVPAPSPSMETFVIPKRDTKPDHAEALDPIPRRNVAALSSQRRPSPPPSSRRQSSPPRRSTHSRGKGPHVNTYIPPPPSHPAHRDLRHFEYCPTDLKFYTKTYQFGSVARCMPPFFASHPSVQRGNGSSHRLPSKYAVMLPPTTAGASTVYAEPKPFGRGQSQRDFEDQRAEFYGIALTCQVPLRNDKAAHAAQRAIEMDVTNPVLNTLSPSVRTWVQRRLYNTVFQPLSARHRVTVLFRHMRYTHASGGIMFNTTGVCHTYAKALADRFAIPASTPASSKRLPCVAIPPESWRDLQKSIVSHVYAMYHSMEDAETAVHMHVDDHGWPGCIVQDAYFLPPPSAPRQALRDIESHAQPSDASILTAPPSHTASPMYPPLPPEPATTRVASSRRTYESRWNRAPRRAPSPPSLQAENEEIAVPNTQTPRASRDERKDGRSHAESFEDGEVAGNHLAPSGRALNPVDDVLEDKVVATAMPSGPNDRWSDQKDEPEKEDRRHRSRDRSSNRRSSQWTPPLPRNGGSSPRPSLDNARAPPESLSNCRRSTERTHGAFSGRDPVGRHSRRSAERPLSFANGERPHARRGSRSPDRRQHHAGPRGRSRDRSGRALTVVLVSCPGMVRDEQLLRSFLRECGHVDNIEWRLTTPGKEFAYVTFHSASAAAIAVRQKDRALLGNVPVRVEFPRGRGSGPPQR